MISIRTAKESDADAIARLVNTAFLVEQFFIERDRTNPATVRSLLEKGNFLLAEDGQNLVGCIYMELRGERGYFGMLSIEPSRQGMGVGHQLVNAVEKYFRGRGLQIQRHEDRQRPNGIAHALPPVGILRHRHRYLR